jgi:hypothetical protein
MFEARSFDLRTGAMSDKPVLVSQYLRALQRDSHFWDHTIFHDHKSGDPLEFCAGSEYLRKGRVVHRSPHFKRMEGYGLKNSDRVKARHQGFAMYGASGKALIVVSGLSDVFAYKSRALNFAGHKDKHLMDVRSWIGFNRGNFFTTHAQSAADAVLRIRDLHNRYKGPHPFKDACFGYYNGGVAPYKRFFLGWQDACATQKSSFRLAQIYNDLSRGRNAVLVTCDADKKTDPNRAVGLPVLLHFVPTKEALRSRGNPDLFGNLVDDPEHGVRLVTALHASEALKNAGGQDDLRRLIVDQGTRGIYVLATPFVGYDPAMTKPPVLKQNGQLRTRVLNFMINDVAAQTCPFGISRQMAAGSFHQTGPAPAA